VNDLLTEIRFWMQVAPHIRKTVFCAPQHTAMVQALIDAEPHAGKVTVRSSDYVPADRLYVVQYRGPIPDEEPHHG
jgi:hypothetical protein